MSIEGTLLYQEMRRRASEIAAAPCDLVSEFERLRGIIQEHAKHVVRLFPEYTPHDTARHLDHLFALADRLLASPLYARLKAAELVLLAFGLYAHDWGMAVSDAERRCLVTAETCHSFNLLPGEPASAKTFLSEAAGRGRSPEVAWRDYVRRTHGLRSGARLRKHLEPIGSVFAEAVAKIAESHTLDVPEVRDTDRYPLALSVFGETVNLAALTAYIRIVDLLDIGDDRTPYALWKFVEPDDPISSMEWQKHRALSPVSVRSGPRLREILVSGRTDDPSVFAALNDLRSWIDSQFALSIAYLRTISGHYDIDLDSRINWTIEPIGFVPRIVRFELDRTRMLRLLSEDLYQNEPLAFVRELLQNSVDAIDARESLLAGHGLSFKGEIHITLRSGPSSLLLEWFDNGIGMDEDILEGYFARVGSSWYLSREFSRIGGPEPISRFGVGILSCFAVAQKLQVNTQQDPLLEGPRRPLVVEIPTCESHFRIRTTTEIPVGTTIRLVIPQTLVSVVSKASIWSTLARIARYVRHTIVIDSEGVTSTLRSLGTISDPSYEPAGAEPTPSITVQGTREESWRAFVSLTRGVTFSLGNPDTDYEGHYSLIAPISPKDTSATVDLSVWMIEGHNVELDDLIVGTEQTLFVKGVQVGPVGGGRGHHGRMGLSLLRYTSWVQPKLLLNVRRPSLLAFNLARSSARVTDKAWLVQAWKEVCHKLRTKVFTWPLEHVQDQAVLLGTCAVFGGVPDEGLEALVSAEECPVLILRKGAGLVWVSLREFAFGDEFVEAPFEIGYACFAPGRDLVGFGGESKLDGWEGEDALFPLHASSSNFPWLGAVVGFGHRICTRLGWAPVGIRLVHGPDEIPFACRVWKRGGVPGRTAADLVGDEWLEPQGEWAALKRLYGEAPDLMRFPASIARYAAIGSRYWNIEHPKIAGIVSVLKELRGRADQRQLSPDGLRALAYFTSYTFYGYVVASRHAGRRLALEVPNNLLEVAQSEGLPRADGLVVEDFLPRTLEGYRNPYYFDLSGFMERGTGLGQPLGPVP